MTTYADYLIIIPLPAAIGKEINRYKRASVNAIGHFEGMNSKAYIPVTHQVRCKPFLAHSAFERMAKRLSVMPPVELHFDGFGYTGTSPTTYSIYAAIGLSTRMDNWFKLLTMQMGIKLEDFQPYVTIAKNVPVTAFNKLWPNFKDREFNYGFAVNNITILHKDTYTESSQWEVYKELRFGNKMLAFCF